MQRKNNKSSLPTVFKNKRKVWTKKNKCNSSCPAKIIDFLGLLEIYWSHTNQPACNNVGPSCWGWIPWASILCITPGWSWGGGLTNGTWGRRGTGYIWGLEKGEEGPGDNIVGVWRPVVEGGLGRSGSLLWRFWAGLGVEHAFTPPVWGPLGSTSSRKELGDGGPSINERRWF